MIVCEVCIGRGYSDRTLNGQCVRVLCPDCLGARSRCLGLEGMPRWRAQRAEAIERGGREGWYEEVWDGAPGEARKVLRRMGPAVAQRRSA
jgi:hypothetical protein